MKDISDEDLPLQAVVYTSIDDDHLMLNNERKIIYIPSENHLDFF